MFPIFTGRVEGGKLTLQEQDRFNAYLASLGAQSVDVVVRTWRKPRSNNQNAYMWGVVYQLISETTGFTPDETHDAMRLMFLLDRSKDIPTLKSTTQLTTTDMELYLENIRQWAAEHLNCVIPLPNEVDL
jgi:hypothetical protein